MPWEPVLNRRGIRQESFLVETRSLGGFSGSPVFTYQPGPPRGTVLLTGQSDKRMPDFLLGVDWGHLPITEKVLDREGKQLPEGWWVESNSGQMAVVPSWKLRELLDTEDLARTRWRADEAMGRLQPPHSRGRSSWGTTVREYGDRAGLPAGG